MYETINGYPVEDFCEWYNEKYYTGPGCTYLEEHNIEYELSYGELEEVADIFLKEKFNESWDFETPARELSKWIVENEKDFGEN